MGVHVYRSPHSFANINKKSTSTLKIKKVTASLISFNKDHVDIYAVIYNFINLLIQLHFILY